MTLVNLMQDAVFLPAGNAKQEPFVGSRPPMNADASWQRQVSPFLQEKAKQRKEAKKLRKKIRENISEPAAFGKEDSIHSNASVDVWHDPHAHGVFVDVNDMKNKVRAHLKVHVYSVKDLYKKRGCWQWMAKHPIFENLTLAVIFVNAIWIAVDTDYNEADVLANAEAPFQVMENFFCTFFVFELLVRFLAFQQTQDAMRDGWFVFDCFLLALMVLETWVMSCIILLTTQSMSGGMGNASILRVARLLRLSRMARMARLLRAMPELTIMIKGMLAAMRSVFITLLLQVIIMYVFGIAFTQLLMETEVGSKHFSSVLESMYSLLIYGTFLDNIGYLTKQIGAESQIAAFFFFVFVLLAALTVMNMLIGVLCEVVSAVAATEKEQMLVTWVRSKIERIVEEIDTNHDYMISRTEFIQILENGHACRALRDVGVDVIGLLDLTDTIFDSPSADGNQKLSFGDFMDVILQLRGCNTATVKDVVDLRKFVHQMTAQTQEYMENVLVELGVVNRRRSTAGSAPDDMYDFIRDVSSASLHSAHTESDDTSERKLSKTSAASERKLNTTSAALERELSKTSAHSCGSAERRVEEEGCPVPLKSTLEAELLSRVQLLDSGRQWEELPRSQWHGFAIPERLDMSCTAKLRHSRSGQRAAGTTDCLQLQGSVAECEDLFKHLASLGEILSTGVYEFEKVHQQLAHCLCIAADNLNCSSGNSGGDLHN